MFIIRWLIKYKNINVQFGARCWRDKKGEKKHDSDHVGATELSSQMENPISRLLLEMCVFHRYFLVQKCP